MGLPMAQALAKANFDVIGYDVRPVSEFASFAERWASVAQLTACDVLLCVVRTQQQILDLCFERQAVFRSAEHPATLIVSSTVSPRFIAKLRQLLPASVELIDAPMSGAPFAAQQSSLSFMLGGGQAEVQRLMALFQAMGDKIFYVGASGQGMAAKVFNNYVAASSVVAVRQAQRMAASWGLKPQQLREIMSRSSGATWFGDNFERIDWAEQGYTADNTIAILVKDVNAALDAVADDDQDPATEACQQAMLAALKQLPPM